jgi:hypothetical protein
MRALGCFLARSAVIDTACQRPSITANARRGSSYAPSSLGCLTEALGERRATSIRLSRAFCAHRSAEVS